MRESATQTPSVAHPSETALWLAVARAVIANTTDVGDSFAEEARKIYYGESLSRHIRGTTTPTEARSLIEEGIDVISLPIPEALKGRLQ